MFCALVMCSPWDRIALHASRTMDADLILGEYMKVEMDIVQTVLRQVTAVLSVGLPVKSSASQCANLVVAELVSWTTATGIEVWTRCAGLTQCDGTHVQTLRPHPVHRDSGAFGDDAVRLGVEGIRRPECNDEGSPQTDGCFGVMMDGDHEADHIETIRVIIIYPSLRVLIVHWLKLSCGELYLWQCVECGGYKTAVSITDSSGTTIGRVGGPSHLAHLGLANFTAALSPCVPLIQRIMRNNKEIKHHNINHSPLGVWGVDSPANVAELTPVLSALLSIPSRPRLVVGSDSHLLASPLRM
ncbi:hypothetical protein BD410DRAFT_809445 [Rickenella mellea]|uniref:Uncharacterized protein n=1 Tax=Rickenella mellea TaxID=50990 RepID=A0A4Y7PH48_9AGAM|nr:hypothetical protein BD410DRAFT_809445 [Rickenella mellea]